MIPMRKMTFRQRNVLRLWAGLDLGLTGLLVFPPVALWFLSLILSLGATFGGQATIDEFSGIGLLFICMSGALGVCWAAARLVRPLWWLGVIDSLARFWIGLLIVYFVIAQAVPVILLLFVVTEWAGSVHQGLVLFRKPAPKPAVEE